MDIERENRHEPFPLTPIQEAYLVGRSSDFVLGGIAAYTYGEADCVGLDVKRLEHAWKRMLERHDMLRVAIDDDGRQRLLEMPPTCQIAVNDLRLFAADDVDRELRSIRDRLAHQCLPVAAGRLWSLEATLLPNSRVRVHLGLDLLICDFWSLRLIQHELAELIRDPDAILKPLRYSFRDYAETQRQNAEGPLVEAAWEYWRSQLIDMPVGPTLPLKVSAKEIERPRFKRILDVVERADWLSIKDFARRFRLTPTVVLLTVYADVLALYSGERRFTLNVTLFDRQPYHEEVNALVGDFTSLIPLVVDMSGLTSFLEKATSIRDRLWEGLDHRLVSGPSIIRELSKKVEAYSGGTLPVVFTSGLGLEKHAFGWEDGMSSWDRMMSEAFCLTHTPQVCLDLVVREIAGGLRHAWSFVDGLVSEELAEALCAVAQEQLKALALTEANWHRGALTQPPPRDLLAREQMNQTRKAMPPERLDELFCRQARKTPLNLAVIDSDTNLTYSELELRSAGIAVRLQEMGQTRGCVVAIVMERGWEQIAAVLGILRAGAAYLPLDPELPEERQHDLLTRCGVSVVLTDRTISERKNWPAFVQTCVVDHRIQGKLEDSTHFPADSEALAYIMFTSGSTGRPKGVMIPHRGAVNSVSDINSKCEVSERDRVIAVSALWFDLSVFDIFGTLSAGAAIVIPPRSLSPEPRSWFNVMRRHGVSIWNSVPALLELLADEVTRTDQHLESLRLVIVSGDWIPLSLPERVRAIAARAKFFAMGGATECSINSTYKWVERVEPGWKSIPYGRPISNHRCHVLNEELVPVPVGTAGHLFIAGDGVALGYWGEPALTERAFINHPISGERLYRTGDLARYLPDGELEFLGRKDSQVKVSGYRIELGEIEAAVSSHHSVSKCAAVVIGAQGESKRLALCIVPAPATRLSEWEILEYARRKLPKYMVPRRVLVLDAFPVTPNGKVDRVSLARMCLSERGEQEVAAGPSTLVAKLSEIWCTVLSLERVGLHENFFELGGDSALAMRVTNRICEVCDCDLTLTVLFDNPSVALMSKYLTAKGLFSDSV